MVWFSYDPWREMDRLAREMSFCGVPASKRGGQSRTGAYPYVNMWSNGDHVILRAELPGIDIEKLAITVHDNTVTIAGEREKVQEDRTYHRQEIPSGSFKRAFQLPFKIEQDKVQASYEKGVLEVDLPRSEVDKPKQIAVKVS